jgi:hypothetical protein
LQFRFRDLIETELTLIGFVGIDPPREAKQTVSGKEAGIIPVITGEPAKLSQSHCRKTRNHSSEEVSC